MTTRYRITGLMIGAAALSLVALSCGDDDDTAAETSTNIVVDASVASAPPASQTGEPSDACTAMIAIDQFEVDHEAADYPENLLPFAELWRTVARTANGEIATDAETMASAIETAVESGDASVLEEGSPEIDTADRAVHQWAYETCGMEAIDLVATDFAYGGVPLTVDAGQIALKMDNDGDEPHVMVLVRVNDDVTETAAEMLAGDEEQIFAKVATVASGGFAAPDESGYLLADVTPGRHVLLCPIETESDGAPHFAHGMVVEFQVS